MDFLILRRLPQCCLGLAEISRSIDKFLHPQEQAGRRLQQSILAVNSTGSASHSLQEVSAFWRLTRYQVDFSGTGGSESARGTCVVDVRGSSVMMSARCLLSSIAYGRMQCGISLQCRVYMSSGLCHFTDLFAISLAPLLAL